MTPRGAPLERGYKLGKYEVIGRISIGGMAELYLAFLAGQGGFKKFVALKRILPAVAEQENFLKMFLDEARITASLSHANIAQVFELTEVPETAEPVLAMEYVAGQNLGEIVRRARARGVPLPVGFSCRVLHDVLLALHSAHHFVDPTTGTPMPVIHRDINPRNIMVTFAGGTKVIDFGIAKARGRLDTTQVGMVKGTLQYMSPEQVMQKEVSGRADLFAASVVLWELLSGRRLFDEPSDAALLNRLIQGDVPSLADAAPGLPPGLAEAVMKGLTRNAEDRWRSGREYARALDQALPDLFDDEQVAELMGRLFEDKIAITRALLQSTTTDASFANLKMMTQGGDEGAEGPVPAPPAAPPLAPTSPARPRLGDEPAPDTITARPAANPASAATQVLDGPVAAAPSDRTEAELEPVGPRPTLAQGADEVPTAPDRPVVEPATTEPGGRKATGEGQATTPARKATADAQPARRLTSDSTPARKPTADSAPARKLTSDSAPARKSTSDSAPARKLTSDSAPARKPTGDGTPTRKPTTGNVPARKPTAEQAEAPPPGAAPKPPLELLPVRRLTADARQVLAPVGGSERTVSAVAPDGARSWQWVVLLVLVALGCAVAFTVLLNDRAPEVPRPLDGGPHRPPR